MACLYAQNETGYAAAMATSSENNGTATPRTAESGGGPGPLKAWWMYAAAALPAVALVAVFAVGLARSVRRSRQWPCETLRLQAVKHGALSDVTLDRLDFIPSSGLRKGGRFALKSLRGKPVLINLWLSSCVPCIREMPSLMELAERAGKGLAMVLVTTDEDLKDLERFYRAHPRFRPHHSQAIVLWDPGGKMAKRLGTRKYPETYFLDRKLRPTHKAVSSRHWTGRAARRCVAHLMEK